MPTLWVTDSDGILVPLNAEGYATEKEFQTLLAENPAVLAGALTDGDSGGQWLLIAQELAIKAEESDTGTWKLDHLFVGSDAMPVLVEVKRSSDRRARREVVAQMLDYAASFAVNWSSEHLRLRREQRLSTSAADGAAEMEEFLAEAGLENEDQFWTEVQLNIDAEKLRLLFVADQLSPTLVDIIEYLNRQLRNTEVLGVEVLRHVSGAQGGPTAYQPVVRGRSSLEAQRKSTTQRRTFEEFEEAVRKYQGETVLESIAQLLERAKDLGGTVSVGTSAENPVLYLNFHTNGGSPQYWPFLVNPKLGKLIVKILKLRTHPAFEDEGVRDELLVRVGAATGSPIQGNTDAAPWVPVSTLTKAGVIDALADVLKWTISTANATHAT